jgi:hypothetical protein
LRLGCDEPALPTEYAWSDPCAIRAKRAGFSKPLRCRGRNFPAPKRGGILHETEMPVRAKFGKFLIWNSGNQERALQNSGGSIPKFLSSR